MATGFQVIALSGLFGKLYVNKTATTGDCGQHTSSCTIAVEESGLYLVAVIPITEGMGVANSHVEYYREILMVQTLDTATTQGIHVHFQ